MQRISLKKPPWINKRINLWLCHSLKRILREYKLYSVCEETRCPNLSECFSKGVVTFLILGNICTRNCSFCKIKKGAPLDVDEDEPQRVKEVVKKLNLRYVVITSPTRDDLEDKGVGIFLKTIKELRTLNNPPKIELLIPDFFAKIELVKKIVEANPQVIAHNLETVPRLYPQIRKGADYKRSLRVLKIIKELNPKIYTKSSLLLGVGEREKEVIEVFKDLRKVGCDFLVLGQYLSPSLNHYLLKEYISPNKFKLLERQALQLGFKRVRSSPYMRSSYLNEI